jgi:hypothetical protein
MQPAGCRGGAIDGNALFIEVNGLQGTIQRQAIAHAGLVPVRSDHHQVMVRSQGVIQGMQSGGVDAVVVGKEQFHGCPVVMSSRSTLVA